MKGQNPKITAETNNKSSRKFRICVLHGYLLTGTGSNIFVNNLVRAFCSSGHVVYLFCQEKKPRSIDFVHQYHVFEEGNRKYRSVYESETPYPGNCILYNPDLKGLLPVYVYDEYEGFKVKTFSELEKSEIDEYIQQNVRAAETVYKEHSFDLIQSNHMIMSPYIGRELYRKYKIPYYITLHGSALNFSVKRDKRLLPYASEALMDSTKIFAVSNHNRMEAMTFFKQISSDIDKKFEIIPAGVDTGLFNILQGSKRDSIDKLKSLLAEMARRLPNGKSVEQKQSFTVDIDQTSSLAEVDKLVSTYNGKYDPGHPDHDAGEMLDQIDWDRDYVILFVGKFLWTKGIQMAISALPIVLDRIPNLHMILVGFGSYREELEALVYSLEAGRRELFRSLIERSISQMSPGDNPEISQPFKFLDVLAMRKLVKDYFKSAVQNSISRHVHFLGALDHQELSYLLPCADGLVAASVFPEAFGMVSIEALACGVFPIVTNQTGFKEIVDLISRTVDVSDGMHRVDLNEEMVFNIATNIMKHIENSDFQGEALKQKCRQLTLDNFSWTSIASHYIAHYSEG